MGRPSLDLFKATVARAERFADLGLYGQAIPLAKHVASASRAPRDVRAAALKLLGRIALEQGLYAKSRRYFHAALTLERRSAYTAFVIGLTYEWQAKPALERAYQYYRLACEWDESEPLYRAAFHSVRVELFGSKHVRRDALRELDRCFTEEPDSPEVALYYLRALRTAGRHGAARWLQTLCRRRWPTLPEFAAPESPLPQSRNWPLAVRSRPKEATHRRLRKPRILRFSAQQPSAARRAAR